jgi:hypothetical protein
MCIHSHVLFPYGTCVLSHPRSHARWHLFGRCPRPVNCSGTWGVCSAKCTKRFRVKQAEVSGGSACEAENGILRHCAPGEGECAKDGYDCTESVQAPKNGGIGTCMTATGSLDHGKGCTLTCDKGFALAGHQPKCANGTVHGSISCSWGGKKLCWDQKDYTFARCCDTRKGVTGDKRCWGGRHTYLSCLCAGPSANCSGSWGVCSANCSESSVGNCITIDTLPGR